MKNLLIFGTGAVATILIEKYLDLECNKILAYVNTVNNVTPPHLLSINVPVIGLDKVYDYDYDYILLASGNYDTMYDQCIKHNIPKNKIIGIIQDCSNSKIDIQNQLNSEIKKMFNLELENLFKKSIPWFCMNTLYFGNELWLNKDLNILENYDRIDIQRSMALKTIAHEIKRRNIKGNVAELGVYKGDFSRIINELFPDRTLYLFDTFDGFEHKDLILENKLSNANTSMFKDTSIDLVLSKMVNKDNCKIVKGYFPQSAVGIEDIFSFVSLDADLYKPIYEGLIYFYKRLSNGGYIFIHDFNNAYFSGSREAVETFCKETNISYVPIPDYNGSAIITK